MARIYITKLSINPEHEYNQIPMYVFVHVKQSFSMRNAAPINIRYPCELEVILVSSRSKFVSIEDFEIMWQLDPPRFIESDNANRLNRGKFVKTVRQIDATSHYFHITELLTICGTR